MVVLYVEYESHRNTFDYACGGSVLKFYWNLSTVVIFIALKTGPSESVDVQPTFGGTLDGHKERQQFDKLLEDPMLKFCGLYQQETADLKVVCQVYADNRPLALPVCTSYKPFSTRWNWNEWVTLPVLFSDLPRNAQLALTVYDCIGCSQTRAVGGTTISLFGKHGVFRRGMMDLKLWPDRAADGNCPSQTPGKTKDKGKIQSQRLAKVRERFFWREDL